MQEPNNGDLLDFAKSWIQSLPQGLLPQEPKTKVFGYPFPKSPKIYKYVGRREQISLMIRDR